MSTPAQAAASRANSLLSTGPVTPEGKAKMFANPLRHGLTSAHLILPGENEQDFLDLLACITQQHNPLGYAETTCVQQIAEAQWRLLRLRRAETASLKHLINGLLEETEGDTDFALALVHQRHSKSLDRFQRYETALTRQLNKAERQVARLQKERFSQVPAESQAKPAGSASKNSSTSENSARGSALQNDLAGSASQNSAIVSPAPASQPPVPAAPTPHTPGVEGAKDPAESAAARSVLKPY